MAAGIEADEPGTMGGRVRYEQEFAAGATIFDEGDPGDRLYVIQSGEVELAREGAAGQRVVSRLGPGDFFGELAVVLGKCFTARAVAIRETRVLGLDRETLEAMCLEQPAIAIRLLRVLVARLIEAERRLAALGVDDLLRPIVRSLLRRAESGADKAARIPTSLRRVAEDTGLTLLEAHRALHQLFERKLIRLEEDVLIAHDLEALSACLDAPEFA